jgi:hypothetical protein
MGDFFAFRTMISSTVIQVVFVLGLVGIVLATIGSFAGDEPFLGLLILIFGTLYWRILCEFLIVVFRMHATLQAIQANTAPSAPGGTVTPATPADAFAPREATTSVSAAQTTPGWYDDSERPGHKRWWDGTAWGMRDDEHPSALPQ